MKLLLSIFTIFFLLNCKPERHITFIVEVPKNTPHHKDVYVSGNFEGWSSGRDQFKLKKKEHTYHITFPIEIHEVIYKFTLGSWDYVERDQSGNNIENRNHTFKTVSDTIYAKVISWADPEKDPAVIPSSNSTATKNVQLLHEVMNMPQLNRNRRIWIYTPTNYETSNKTYPVLYMHDGQNIFDVATSYAGEWEVDESLNWLQNENGLELIVVAIDNGEENRMNEYSPWKNRRVPKPQGEAYINFIVQTLKPHIDSTFRTKPDKMNTAIMGSSMGGLISHYAALKHPDIFGKAGVFSPSFWISDNAFQLTKNNSKRNKSRMYLLVGSKEGDEMVSNTKKMANVMIKNGFESSNLITKIVDDGIHGERLWIEEFPEAISWLFNKPKPRKRTFDNFITAKPLKNLKLAGGKLLRIDNFPSQYITPRPVDIWLPNNYSDDKTYSVLYMHDGQMLFDANSTWNKQEWKVDEWATQLINEEKTKDFIVVAIHNISDIRWLDLFPQKAIHFIPKKTLKALKEEAKIRKYTFELNGDNYLKFLVKELKPYVDNVFSTKTNKENTFVMGSSMGGLMSMYAISEYPEIFAGAACLSTHWIGAEPKKNNPYPEAIFKYMETNLPAAGKHKLYFDYGNKTLDEHYPRYAPRVDEILKQKGYTNTNSKNIFFEDTDHSENSWNQRLDVPLLFLLEK